MTKLPACRRGRDEAAAAGLTNACFIHHDAAELAASPELGSASFDWILAFDAIHDQTRPSDSLQGWQEVYIIERVFSMSCFVQVSGAC